MHINEGGVKVTLRHPLFFVKEKHFAICPYNGMLAGFSDAIDTFKNICQSKWEVTVYKEKLTKNLVTSMYCEEQFAIMAVLTLEPNIYNVYVQYIQSGLLITSRGLSDGRSAYLAQCCIGEQLAHFVFGRVWWSCNGTKCHFERMWWSWKEPTLNNFFFFVPLFTCETVSTSEEGVSNFLLAIRNLPLAGLVSLSLSVSSELPRMVPVGTRLLGLGMSLRAWLILADGIGDTDYAAGGGSERVLAGTLEVKQFLPCLSSLILLESFVPLRSSS